MFRQIIQHIGLDRVSFSCRQNREIDVMVEQLRQDFSEPFLIERSCAAHQPYIRVILVSECDRPNNHAEVRSRMMEAVGTLPIEFENITFRSIGKLFNGLRALAAE